MTINLLYIHCIITHEVDGYDAGDGEDEVGPRYVRHYHQQGNPLHQAQSTFPHTCIIGQVGGGGIMI